MSLTFTSEQIQVSSIFTQHRNTIDVYTEDTENDKAFYKKLFRRLLEGTEISLSDVYPLGSSKEVFDACRRDTDTSRKKLYIVDGDIYMLFAPKASIPNLFVLDSYCMENMVIDKNSVCNVACIFHARKELDEVEKHLQFDALLVNHAAPLVTLFFYKALSEKHLGYFNLKSLSAYYDKQMCLDMDKISAEQNAIKQKILESGTITNEQFMRELANMEKEFPKTPETLLKVVSGKDFLIHMIQCCASKSLGLRQGHDKITWKYNLANYCNLDRLQPLKDRLLSL